MKDNVKRWAEKDGITFLKEIGVEEGYTILDFGCGEGHYTIPASKAVGKNGNVYALDKDKGILNKLEQIITRGNIKNIELIKENSKIPLEDNFLDIVLCYDIIHYESREKRAAIYNEIHRVLKKRSLFSVYPKHHREDKPLNELADMDLEDIIKEIGESGFILKHKFLKNLLHDDYYNKGYILNFRKD